MKHHRTIEYTTYLDKVRGGWVGKCAGGVLGAPIEGYKSFNNIELTDDLFDTNFPNDDLDLQVVWLDMVKQKAPWVRETDFAQHWKQHVRFPWGEYGVAERNLSVGLAPPDAGVHNNHYWYRGMGSPIRSELWGMLCPGMPEQAAFYAAMDSSVDHGSFSIDAERFLSACAAEAFFEDDLDHIFGRAVSLLDPQSEMAQLVRTVSAWARSDSYEVAMGKIKSYYGDADFTSAPMNIAFTLLALLKAEGRFDSIMDALHLGHDSDCIVATTGALLGIMIGYEQLDERWKTLVGDELLVSPEIVGIEHAHTISGLAQETAQAALPFVAHYGHVKLNQAPAFSSVPVPPFHLGVSLGATQTFGDPDAAMTLSLTHESWASQEQSVRLVFRSDTLTFNRSEVSFTTQPSTKSLASVSCVLTEETQQQVQSGRYQQASFSYFVDVHVDGVKVGSLERGIPYYGSWLLLGPFIEDHPGLASMDADYPDHGLASLPSFQYMNRDRLHRERDYLSMDTVREIADQDDQQKQAQPFMVQRIYPGGFRINPGDYYHGRGERTLYLYTRWHSETAQQKWLVLGCSVFFRVWVNGTELHNQETIERAWPYNVRLLIDATAGTNDLLIRLDTPVDEMTLEAGFKDFDGKHAHQSFWSTTVVPFV